MVSDKWPSSFKNTPSVSTTAATVTVPVAWSTFLIVTVASDEAPVSVTSVPKVPVAPVSFITFVSVSSEAKVAVIVVEPSEPVADTVSPVVNVPDLLV